MLGGLHGGAEVQRIEDSGGGTNQITSHEIGQSSDRREVTDEESMKRPGRLSGAQSRHEV